MSEESESYRTRYEPQRDEPWPTVYFGLFGRKLDDEEVAAIESVIKHAVRDLRPWETTKAVRRCAKDSPQNARKFAPTGEEIIRAIYALRREYRAKQGQQTVNGYGPHICPPPYPSFDPETGTHRSARLVQPQDWQDQLRNARDPVERWNIICEPIAKEQALQREMFCVDNGLHFERYLFDRLFDAEQRHDIACIAAIRRNMTMTCPSDALSAKPSHDLARYGSLDGSPLFVATRGVQA